MADNSQSDATSAVGGAHDQKEPTNQDAQKQKRRAPSRGRHEGSQSKVGDAFKRLQKSLAAEQGDWKSKLIEVAGALGELERNAKSIENLAKSLPGWVDRDVVPLLHRYYELCDVLGIGLGDLFQESTALQHRTDERDTVDFRKCVLERLRQSGCHDLRDRQQIAQFLLDRRVRPETAEQLARRILVWNKFDFSMPTLSELVCLSPALKLQFDAIFEGTLPVPAATPIPGSRDDGASTPFEWLTKYLEKSNLHCYAVYADKLQVEQWKQEARDDPKRFEEDNERIKAAQNWISQVNVFAASRPLADDHNLDPDVIPGRPVPELLVQRLRWISQCGEKFIPIMRLAQRKAYLAIYDGLLEHFWSHPPVPAKYREYSDDVVRSLRVTFDRIPEVSGQIGWMVYYHWGDPLSDHRIDELLNKANQLDRPNAGEIL